MSEPWVNFSDAQQELDIVIFLRSNRLVRVHIFRRTDGSFGRRNFVWIDDEFNQCWTVGSDWGHYYDTIAIAVHEARGDFPWIDEYMK